MTQAEVLRVQRLQAQETAARRDTYRAQIAYLRARLDLLQAEADLGLRSAPDATGLRRYLEHQVAFYEALLARDPAAIQMAITQSEDPVLGRAAAGGR